MQAGLNAQSIGLLVFDFAARGHKGGWWHGAVRCERLGWRRVFLWLLGHFVAALFAFCHGRFLAEHPDLGNTDVKAQSRRICGFVLDKVP